MRLEIVECGDGGCGGVEGRKHEGKGDDDDDIVVECVVSLGNE